MVLGMEMMCYHCGTLTSNPKYRKIQKNISVPICGKCYTAILNRELRESYRKWEVRDLDRGKIDGREALQILKSGKRAIR